MTKSREILFAVAAFALWPGLAASQPLSAPSNFGVKSITFDTWCQDRMRYSADRCAARSAADEKAFTDYRSAIERYEIEHLKQVQREYDIRERTNRDPTATVSNKRDGFR